MNAESLPGPADVPVTASEQAAESDSSATRQAPPKSDSLLDLVLQTTDTSSGPAVLDRFLAEESPERLLNLWLQQTGRKCNSKQHLARLLNRDVWRLDALLNDQVNAILHHPRFQKLEASWRGLEHLVEQADDEHIKIRALNVTWKELARDFERAAEFDQSELFRKVYSQEFGTAGGEPYSILLGDYEIRPHPGPGHPVDDVSTLRSISQVAAAAFAPFVAASHPSMLGLDDFAELQRPLNLRESFDQVEYVKWNAFRETEDARFVGLAMPRVLMRQPYRDDGSRTDGFRFQEQVQRPDRSQYLWGNACYAFGSVVIRAFSQHGWLADIRGVERGEQTAGLVTGFPVHSFAGEKTGVAVKSMTDAMIVDTQEKLLGEIGFIPVCYCKDTEFAAFFGNQSVHKPKHYDRAEATANAKLSSMLQYMLCVSRFAHYIKVMGRDKVGSFAEASELESYLSRWFVNYVLDSEDASLEQKARYPLREAGVQIREHPGKPGSYLSVIHLRPHFQLDELSASVRLVTELSSSESR